MYKVGDIVKIQSRSGTAIPPFHVKLLKKIIVKQRPGNKIVWPGYIGWEAKLVYKKEAEKLRKNFGIPFKFPDSIDTFVFENEIIKRT